MSLPAVRGDYQLVETYATTGRAVELRGDRPGGRQDPEAAVAEAKAWADHSTGPFDLQVFPGGHFYLVAEQHGVIAAIRDRLGVGARSS